jgi:hypothetical protein
VRVRLLTDEASETFSWLEPLAQGSHADDGHHPGVLPDASIEFLKIRIPLIPHASATVHGVVFDIFDSDGPDSLLSAVFAFAALKLRRTCFAPGNRAWQRHA